MKGAKLLPLAGNGFRSLARVCICLQMIIPLKSKNLLTDLKDLSAKGLVWNNSLQ